MTRTTGTAPAAPAVDLPSPKERLRLREAKALSQAQVAEIVGVTRETVRSWELGRTSPRGRKRDLYVRLLTTEPALHGRAAPLGAPGPDRRARPDSAGPLGRRDRRPKGAGKGAAPGGAEPSAQAKPGTAPVPAPALPALAAPEPGPSRKRLRPRTTRERPSRSEAVAVVEPSRRTPCEAFDHLYSRTAPSLLRQAYLLTGRHRLSQETVERAFQLAWQRWPEVATDRDPAGWVRAAAYEYALSPWHRFRPSHLRVNPPSAPRTESADPAPHALLEALLELPPAYRRTLVLYDGLGLDLPETAAETEATTPAAAHRLEHARAVVARRVPELGGTRSPAEQSALLQERLSALAAAQPVDALPTGRTVRTRSERTTRFWTRAAIAFTTLIIGATSFTLTTAPTRYEAPVPPGARVGGVPVLGGPQHLDFQDEQLRAKLRADPDNGPQRLVPQGR
ncbi:sigma factor-like helix-turn-helix DNA-binding protein [Streptomyces sp. NPDC088745]|uniref:sigma factor-like helix-turn-helix DNA-binding protein n=1 Tax=Streptomyces sp. NPDC088745 TaxID=3365884 RepID=UPI0037FBAB3B